MSQERQQLVDVEGNQEMVLPGPLTGSSSAEDSNSVNAVRIRKPHGGTAPHGTSDQSYEEFFSGTVPCPSCRGLGRIPKEQESQLVALIPLNDSRLKPRRTLLYVFIAIILCALVGGMLMFFLLPRSVDLASDMNKIIPINSYVNMSEEYVSLTLRTHYNISNRNYFEITVVQMQVTTMWDTKVMQDVTNNTQVRIPMRQQISYSVDLNVTFSGDEGYIAYYCDSSSKFAHSLLMPFDAIATFNYLGHQEEATLTTYQHVICSRGKGRTNNNNNIDLLSNHLGVMH
jgi:hypothetical protein